MNYNFDWQKKRKLFSLKILGKFACTNICEYPTPNFQFHNYLYDGEITFLILSLNCFWIPLA